jgi:hypothetical protein
MAVTGGYHAKALRRERTDETKLFGCTATGLGDERGSVGGHTLVTGGYHAKTLSGERTRWNKLSRCTATGLGDERASARGHTLVTGDITQRR